MNRSTIAAIISGIIGMVFITWLLLNEYIGEASFVILFIVVIMVAIVIQGFNRLLELDLKNLKLTLDKIQTAKQDIFAKEKDLREITTRLTEILAMISAFQGRWGSVEINELKKKWYMQKTEELLDKVEIDPDKRKAIMRILDEFDKIDALETDEEKSPHHKAIIAIIEGGLVSNK